MLIWRGISPCVLYQCSANGVLYFFYVSIASFEIINKDLYIGTLEKGKNLEIEMTVESGVGYKVAADVKTAL